MSPIRTIEQIIGSHEHLTRAAEATLTTLKSQGSMLDRINTATEILEEEIEASERVLGDQCQEEID